MLPPNCEGKGTERLSIRVQASKNVFPERKEEIFFLNKYTCILIVQENI